MSNGHRVTIVGPKDEQVLEGSANIVVNGQVFTVNAGESIVFPANAPHALTAIERFKMLLTMIKE